MYVLNEHGNRAHYTAKRLLFICSKNDLGSKSLRLLAGLHLLCQSLWLKQRESPLNWSQKSGHPFHQKKRLTSLAVISVDRSVVDNNYRWIRIKKDQKNQLKDLSFLQKCNYLLVFAKFEWLYFFLNKTTCFKSENPLATGEIDCDAKICCRCVTGGVWIPNRFWFGAPSLACGIA